MYKYVLYISLDNLLKNYVFPSNMRTIFSASWMKEKNGSSCQMRVVEAQQMEDVIYTGWT